MLGSDDEHMSETEGQGQGVTGIAAGMEDDDEEQEQEQVEQELEGEETPIGAVPPHQETDDGSSLVLNEAAVHWSMEIIREESAIGEGEDEQGEELEQPGPMLLRFDIRAEPDNDIGEPDEDELEQSGSEEQLVPRSEAVAQDFWLGL